jgi:chaperone BCS1
VTLPPLDTNSLLGTGVLLGLAYAVFQRASGWAKASVSLAARQFYVTLTLHDSTPIYYWVTQYLAEVLPTPRTVTASVAVVHNAPLGAAVDDKDDQRVVLNPAPGVYRVWFEGRPAAVTVSRTEAKNQSSRDSESVTLRFLSRDPQIARRFLAAARDAYDLDTRIPLIQCQYGGQPQGGRRLDRRPLSSVVLPVGVAEKTLAELKRFLASAEWYRDRGIPWRTGVCLEGPPGSGKTSFAIALASELSLRIAYVNLSTVDDSGLASFVTQLPPRTLMLLEDVDTVSATQSRTPRESPHAEKARQLAAASGRPQFVREVPGGTVTQYGPGGEETQLAPGEGAPAEVTVDAPRRLTLGGLLNALDGAVAGTGVIAVLTTNHPDKLDPAILRPGRVDRRIHLGPASAEQAARLYRLFFPQAIDALAADFARAASGRSMAELQGHLLARRDDPEAAAREPFDAPPVGGTP